jgi:hypothetical protein
MDKMDVRTELKDFLKPGFFGQDKCLLLEFRSSETLAKGRFGDEYHFTVWIESRKCFKTLSLFASGVRHVSVLLDQPNTEKWVGLPVKAYLEQKPKKDGSTTTVISLTSPLTLL